MPLSPLDRPPHAGQVLETWPRNGAPGAALTIADHGDVRHETWFGLADIERRRAIGPATSFHLASLTKQFTAMAIMLLADRGELRLDDRLASILTEFSGDAAITIEHLLHHTAGLRDYEEEYPLSAAEPVAADAVRFIAGQPISFPPGSRWEYSNSGYVCLARIVEVVAAQSFADFIKANIFAPLDMRASRFYQEASSNPANEALGYEIANGEYREVPYSPLHFVYGADGVHSTPGDVIRSLRAWEPGVLVGEEILRRAFEPAILGDGTRVGYGYGWFIDASRGFRRVSHTGSCDGFRHVLVYHPDTRSAVMVLSNLADFDDVARSATVCALEQEYLMAPRATSTEAPLSAVALSRYVGEYEMDSDETLRLAPCGGLLCVTPPRLCPLRLAARSASEFVVAGAEWDSYHFLEDERGEIETVLRRLSLFGDTPSARATGRRVIRTA